MIPAVAPIPFMTFRLSILGKRFSFRALSSSLLAMVRFLCFSVYSGLDCSPRLVMECRSSTLLSFDYLIH